MSRKRKVKEEVVEKKIKVEDYCYSCQKDGHILSEKCVDSAVCLDCGIRGHVKRDCKAERSVFKEEIKAENKTEIKDEINSDVKNEIKSEVKSEIKMEIKSEDKSEINDKIRSEVTEENEYVEQEIPKDEPQTDEESESEDEYIEKEDDDLKEVKVEKYCILCQTYGKKKTTDQTPKLCSLCKKRFESKSICEAPYAEAHYAGKSHQRKLKVMQRKKRKRLLANTSEEKVQNYEQNEMNLEYRYTVKKHPVQLLNELSGKAVQYEMVAKIGEGPGAVFVMECKINDKTFKGQAKRKKEAKKHCALKVLAEVHQITYPK